MSWADGTTRIARDGAHRKFVAAVEQISYSGSLGRERDQDVLYVTERAVFRLVHEGLELVEVAPGIDIGRDVLAKMAFRPLVPAPPRTMDPRLFRPQPIGLAQELARKGAPLRSPRLATLDGLA